MMASQNFSGISVNGYVQENGLIFVETRPTQTNSPFYYNFPFKAVKVGAVDRPTFTIPNDTNGFLIDQENVDALYGINRVQQIVGYKNIDTDEEISVTEYLTRKNELLKAFTKGEDADDEGCWASVSDKFQFELFQALWVSNCQYFENYQLIKVNLIGEVPKVDNPYISAVRKVGGDLRNTLYFYDRSKHIIDLVDEVFSKAGFKVVYDDKFSINSRLGENRKTVVLTGNLKFSKVFLAPDFSAKYLSTEIPRIVQLENLIARFPGPITGTYEECQRNLETIENMVKGMISEFVLRDVLLSEALNATKLAEFSKVFNTLKDAVYNIESMKKTSSYHSTALTKVRELEKILSDALLKTNS
jgi:hypothetical protein